MKVLIVDDEPGLASGLAQWLVEKGWETPGVATTSDEAVDWINLNGGPDVMVCDVVLQPADGLTLRETLMPHLPQMKTIFISGYDLTDYASRMVGATHLQKPVSGDALEQAIRKLFEPVVAPAPVVQAVASAPKAVAAVATAKPAAATPVATAKPVAATATPKTAATPKAAVAATPAATPRPAAATPTAKPAAVVASASATPKAASAAPKVAAKAAAPAVAAKASRPAPAAVVKDLSGEAELPPDELVGTTLKNYQIEAKIGQSSQGGVYRANQVNMGRQVRFYALDRERAQDPAEIQRFISNASVKANVSHPYIFAVYEAGESDGIYFYSCEYVPCRSLRQLKEQGVQLDEVTALQALKVAAEVLAYFSRENIPHELINENGILIGAENRARIANIAAHQPVETTDTQGEIRQLGKIISGALPENSTRLGVRQLALSLVEGNNPALQTFAGVSQAATELEPKVTPEDAFKIDAQERAAIRMVEESKVRARRNMMINSLVSLALLFSLLFSVYWFLIRSRGGTVRDLQRLVKIPAGEFIYQNGEKIKLPEFYIDQYEVTIAQYAEFLAYLAEHPEEEKKFAHEKQPQGKSHVPVDWADKKDIDMLGYYEWAKKWGKYRNFPLEVNSPVFGVDWFDAYAYAKWKGRRLPTEQEWEKAARGTGGFQYPWGNEGDLAKANTGSDHHPNPKEGGDKDGYKKWAPVDAIKGDKSEFDVRGMAGNVSEWTATYDADPQMPSQKNPVIRGGNWKNPDYKITRRVLLLPDLGTADTLGFRTVSDTPPAK